MPPCFLGLECAQTIITAVGGARERGQKEALGVRCQGARARSARCVGGDGREPGLMKVSDRLG